MAARSTKAQSKAEVQSAPEVVAVVKRTVSPYSLMSLASSITDNAGLLFIALSIFIVGFLVGSLWTENKMLKSGTGTGTPTAAAQPTGQQGAPTTPTTATVDLGDFPVKGDKNAKIAIVEFADMRCPFCKKFFQETEPQLIKEYVDTGKAKFAFRNYSFLGPASTLAANAVECANEQGKFWQMYDYLYTNQPSESDTSMYTNENMTKIATQLGANGGTFNQCMVSTKYASKITADIAAGNQVGGGSLGTPSFVIGKIGDDGKVSGQLLVGAQPIDAFKTILDAIK